MLNYQRVNPIIYIPLKFMKSPSKNMNNPSYVSLPEQVSDLLRSTFFTAFFSRKDAWLRKARRSADLALDLWQVPGCQHAMTIGSCIRMLQTHAESLLRDTRLVTCDLYPYYANHGAGIYLQNWDFFGGRCS